MEGSRERNEGGKRGGEGKGEREGKEEGKGRWEGGGEREGRIHVLHVTIFYITNSHLETDLQNFIHHNNFEMCYAVQPRPKTHCMLWLLWQVDQCRWIQHPAS